MDDKAIIALFFARDESAIAETDRAHGAVLRRMAVNILSVFDDAEECVSDTYLRAWNTIPPTVPASLRAYLGRIVRNLSLDRRRSQSAQKRYGGMEALTDELEDCVPSPGTVEGEVEAAEMGAAIGRWLSQLGADDRALFVRRYWYGDAVKSLAAELGCTESQMAQRMLKLRKSLKRALEKEELI